MCVEVGCSERSGFAVLSATLRRVATNHGDALIRISWRCSWAKPWAVEAYPLIKASCQGRKKNTHIQTTHDSINKVGGGWKPGRAGP